MSIVSTWLKSMSLSRFGLPTPPKAYCCPPGVLSSECHRHDNRIALEQDATCPRCDRFALPASPLFSDDLTPGARPSRCREARYGRCRASESTLIVAMSLPAYIGVIPNAVVTTSLSRVASREGKVSVAASVD